MALEDAKKQVDQAFARDDPRGLTYENTFGGALSFARRRYSKDLSGVDVAITGVPFDQSVTNRTGTRMGPRAVREASALQVYDPPYGWGGYDPLSHLSIGGDHYITLPLLQAHAEKYGPLAVVHFDAHSDTWVDDDLTRIDHGTMMYKAVKQGFVDVTRSVQVGIRTTNPDTMGFTTLDARQVHLEGPMEIARKIKEIVGDAQVYMTFDIDALDPAYAPGTGTPVWGGLTSAQAAIILRDLAGINLVGGDMVEVSPPYDTTGATAIAGAHVLMEMLCLWGWTRRG